MVFPGRFSTGCLRCRQRKVKVSPVRSATLFLLFYSFFPYLGA